MPLLWHYLVMYELGTEHPEVVPDFKAGLDVITNRSLSVEVIDTYAEQALNDLIDLIQHVSTAYSRQPSYSFENAKDLENAAFTYFELSQIEEILDHIVDKAREISQLDQTIARAQVIDQIIVPPDPQETNITSGDGTFEEKTIIPKLKTLLFILSNDFEVNIQDKKQTQITKGLVSEDMLRKTSYHLVEVPRIDRAVLICDEEGNATFVFNTDLLGQIGIPPAGLLQLSKLELATLLTENRGLGQRISYSTNFIPNLIRALEAIKGDESSSVTDEAEANSARYLRPKPPEGFLHEYGVAQQFGVNNHVIHRAVKALESSLGETQTFKSKSRETTYYSPAQQELIRQRLEAEGTLLDQTPEGFISIITYARANRVAYNTVINAIEKIGDGLGDLRTFKFRSTPAIGLSPNQQELILRQLELDGSLAERPSDGVLSFSKFAGLLEGVSTKTLDSIVKEMGEAFGEIRNFKFGSITVPGVTPGQQHLVRRYLAERGMLAEPAPESILSIKGLARLLDTYEKPIEDARSALADSLGEVATYSFNGNITLGFSPTQQERIRQHLVDQGFFDSAPEDFLSITGTADKLKVSSDTIVKTISELGESLGEVRQYKFNTVFTTGYSPEQQEQIRQHLEARGYFNLAPEGFLTTNTLAKNLNVPRGAIVRATNELGEALGKVETYKFNYITLGYSPEQQDIIRQYLLDKSSEAS